MSGYKLEIPTRFTDTSLPVLRDDPILTHGSLILVEPNHPAAPVSGLPANGSRLPNIAAKEAAKLMGVAATNSDLSAPYVRAGNGYTWRTPKGALQWSGGGTNTSGALVPLKVLEHIEANPTHNRYVSWWGGYVSGAGISGQITYATLDSGGALANRAWSLFGTTGGYANDAVGPRRVSTSQQYTGTINTTAAKAQAQSRLFGFIPPNGTPGTGQLIFTRFYLEDLTISGRTAAEVDALDAELFARHVTNTTGRYYGETYASR